MKTTLTALTAVALALCLWGGVMAADEKPSTLHLPWKAAGLTERQAAAHLLNRFAFGPRPGEVDAVVKMGLDRWLERQLGGDLPDGKVEEDLHSLPALHMATAEIVRTYPPTGLVLRQAREAGVLSQDVAPKDLKGDDKKALRQKVLAWAQEQGYHPEKELIEQLMVQKLTRAVESENQLGEVMTDFWFNHFNISLTNGRARPYLLPYERDAIRPYALARFRDLLEATAKSPAMLIYLDNAQSAAPEGATTTMQDEMQRRPVRMGARGRFGGGGGGFGGLGKARPQPAAGKKGPKGLNENYARELMELHTLGVDGGYTQQDVIEVARAFTGWTVLPAGKAREQAENRLAKAQMAGGLGFHSQGEFLFRADQHDAGPKTVLGVQLPAGRGIEDGEAVLDLLASHRATARHIAGQLAVRFVSDHPSPALVDRLADVYLKTGGDSRRLLIAIAESPEFWSKDAVGAKVKSPFELAASALRATGSRLDDPKATLQWIARMGQPLYAYQAPTGYPDRAEAWVNTGSLLNRMNFGLQLAAGRVKGVGLDLPALDGGHEPESREAALKTYSALLMPGRDLTATLKLLTPMVTDPNLAKKVDKASPRDAVGRNGSSGGDADEELLAGAPEMSAAGVKSVKVRGRLGDEVKEPVDRRPPTPLEQVVGVILGSPEFQRR
ncbi:MAG TPA: DUF1800 domain-containing protein [Thermoanaerobaculia bacterium]|jgi:uncharacterized protein (DUF1800 family)|nr:DUF1800 domain-containing protein [Thermoanaerobaculia bacterium]